MRRFRVWSNYWKRYAIEAELYMDGSVDAIFEDADGVPHHENTDLIVEFKTGLKDKNGKEIYEGGIVNYADECTCVIQYEDEGARFIHRDISDGFPFGFNGLGQYNGKLFEVIGNIHENSELLEEGKWATD